MLNPHDSCKRTPRPRTGARPALSRLLLLALPFAVIVASCSEQPLSPDVAPSYSAFISPGDDFDDGGTTRPSVTPSITGDEGENGWYISDVTVVWTLSGADSSSGCSREEISWDTPGTTLTCIATNDAGSTTRSVTIQRDATPPTLAPMVEPNPVQVGGSATATANAFDATSGIANQGCGELDTSTAGTRSVTCTATDNAGNTAEAIASYTVEAAPPVDTTPPVITATINGTLGNNGWYASDVSVTWSVTDEESEITEQVGCSSTTINTDTAGQVVTCSATSAGGTASESVTIRRDATPPTLAPMVEPNPVLVGGSATATANASDATSGIANQGCGALDTSTAGTRSVTCTATDNAGNTATAIASYTVEAAPVVCEPGTFNQGGSCVEAPAGSFVSGTGATEATLCAAGTFQPEPGQTGCIPAPAGSSVSGTGATEAELCAAGFFQPNSGETGCIPAPAGSFVSGTGATAATLCAAGTFQPESGETGCIPAPVGTFVSDFGATEATPCPAGTTTEGEGSTSSTACVSVLNFDFNGFFAPVRNDAVNVVRSGRAIPIKFSLGGDQGLEIFEPGFPASRRVTCEAGAIQGEVVETMTAGRSSLSYDPMTQEYTYVWSTERSWGGTCRVLTVRLIDGSEHSATFRFNR